MELHSSGCPLVLLAGQNQRVLQNKSAPELVVI